MFKHIFHPLRVQRGALTLPQALRQKDLLIVDVRSVDEVAAGNFCPGALHIPLNSIPTRIKEVAPDTTRPIVLYCAKGIRSKDAATFLKNIGYTNAFSATDGPSVQKLLETIIDKQTI
jgi:phage shock protein E